MYIKRYLDVKRHLKEKSVLLLGPRRTGKSFYIQNQVLPDAYFNLLDSRTFAELSYSSAPLKTAISSGKKIICIDEVQKLPNLMDEVHSLIEANKSIRFILTGSSAKRIKSSHTSLMAGRARQLPFFPFCYPEIKSHDFDLKKILHFGGLPDVYLAKEPWEELKDYSGTYLFEEIQSSAFVRKIENYSRFLEFAANCSGQILNFEKIANDSFIPARTIRDYYHLLEETLIGYNLRPMRKSNSRKEVSTNKFYFFDTGVLNSFIKRRTLNERTKEFGDLFEHFIFLELKSYQMLNRADWDLEFWRTQTQDEVDFVIGRGEIIIEVKCTQKYRPEHSAGLKKFKKLYGCKRAIIVGLFPESQIIDEVEVLPWKTFLEMLWAKEIC